MDNLTKAFAQLRKQGLFARQNFWCCQGCGCAAVPDTAEGYVFYHNQDNERKRAGKDFYLAYGVTKDSCLRAETVGKIVVDTLAMWGIETEWNGDTSTRIKVIQVPKPVLEYAI